jgi:uncharacterized protein (DUF1015 family)
MERWTITDFERDVNLQRAITRQLEQHILMTDEKPTLYLDEHIFTYRGKSIHRRSLYCLVKLEDWSKMVVRPHEGTLARAKSDRLNMLWALQTNTSPIMALYEDKEGKLPQRCKL